MTNGESSAMSISAALTITGAGLLYLAMVRAGGGPRASSLRDLVTGPAGAVAVSAGCVLAVTSIGWGVGLTSFVAVLTLALSLLALATPLWPQPTRAVVGVVVTLLLAHGLGGP